MIEDSFVVRLTRVRIRFARTLAIKIDETVAAVPKLSFVAPSAAAAVAKAYRHVHSIVGAGPTVGFPATGHAARNVEAILQTAQQERRGLTAGEIALLTRALRVLRVVAARELRPSDTIRP
jgi:chemotaxis protein histidine kinase CheA